MCMLMMDHQQSSSSLSLSYQQQSSLSQLSQLLMEENVTHQSEDQIALHKEGCKAASFIWRERVAQWCYDVVDHLCESRSTVYVAMNILDRYFVNCVSNNSSSINPSDRSYEAAALTALFLAVRIRGAETLEVVDLVRMSRLGVTIKEIVDVGKEMTRYLSFERRLLTPTDFLQELVKYLPASDDSYDEARVKQLTEAAVFYTEVCIMDSFFAGVKASEIALASMLNALDTDVVLILEGISAMPGVKFNPDQVSSLCARLRSVRYNKSGGDNNNGPHIIPDIDDDYKSINPNRQQVASKSSAHIISSEQICIKRSYPCTTLSDLHNDAATPTKATKRPISPTVVTDCKRHRSL